MVENLVNDNKKIEAHKRALKIIDTFNRKCSLFDELKEEFKAIHGRDVQERGLNQFIPYRLDISNTKEAHDKNMAIMEKMDDLTESNKMLYEYCKNAFEIDKTKFTETDIEKNLDIFESNYEDVMGLYTIDRIFGTLGGHTLNPEFKELFYNTKAFIEGGSHPKAIIDYLKNPCTLLMPDEVDPMVFMVNAPKLVKSFDKILGDNKIDGVNTDEIDTRRLLGTFSAENLTFKQSMEEEIAPFKKLFDDGKVPRTIGYTHKIVKDGEDVNIKNALKAMTKGAEGYKIVKRTPEEMEKLQNLFNHTVVNKEKLAQYTQEKKTAFTELRNELKNAQHWYQLSIFNHNEYKNIMNKMNEALTQPAYFNSLDEMQKLFKDVTNLCNAYINVNKNSSDSMRQKRMGICNRIIELCKPDGKTLSSFCTALDDGVDKKFEQQLQDELAYELGIDNECDKSIDLIDVNDIPEIANDEISQ